jgi:hypothetical protein
MVAKVMPNVAKIPIARQRITSIVAIGGFELSPLHTQGKSRDHEIVRARKKVSKGCPNTLPELCSVVINPQV